MSPEVRTVQAMSQLMDYCQSEEYKGWDPYDGLNSKLFQKTPLKHWDVARLVLIQTMKRSPLNFRKLLLIPKMHNPKGIGLFLNGFCNLYRICMSGETRFGTQEELLIRINDLAELLISLKSEGYSGACWGYNFDWQSRRSFLFPAYTPTVVATTFCATALFEAYNITKNKKYLQTALSSADFILSDLNRTNCPGGFILSYSPMKGNDTVYNASLLGAKLLSYCFHYTGNELYKNMARQIVNAACVAQESDGSWVYGLLPVQSWKDSFHTGYNLDSIAHYIHKCDDTKYQKCLDQGLEFYVNNFFHKDGKPKYYYNKTYPIDIHCPAQLWVTLSTLKVWENYSHLTEKVMNWTIENMQDSKGFFYYQLKKCFSSKISYMRWSNAFMFNALSYYLSENNDK